MKNNNKDLKQNKINDAEKLQPLEKEQYENDINIKKYELEHIVNSIPGGVATFFVPADLSNGMELAYCSEGVAALSGRTVEEFRDLYNNHVKETVYSGDYERVVGTIVQSVVERKEIDITYRAVKKDGSIFWMRMCAKVIGEKDGKLILHAVYQNISGETEMYRTILDASNDIIQVCDKNTFEVLYANRAALEQAGDKDGMYAGKKCYEYFMGCDKQCRFCGINKNENGKNSADEVIVEKTGRIYKVKNKETVWHGREVFAEYMTDITEEKEKERNLHRKNNELRRLYKTTPCWIFTCKNDEAWTMLVCNNGLTESTGYTKEQFLIEKKNSVASIIPENDRKKIRVCINYLIMTGKSQSYETTIIRRDGTFTYINVNLSINDDSDYREHNSIIFNVVCADVTDLHLAKLSAARQAKYLQQLYDTLPCGISQHIEEQKRTDFPYIYVNKTGIKIFGADIENKKFAHIYDEDIPKLEKIWEEMKKSTEGYECDYRMVRPDGKIIWLRSIITKIKDPVGNNIYQNLFLDITKQMRAEKALSDSEEKYRLALDGADIITHEYDVSKKQISSGNLFGKETDMPQIIENVPESLIQAGMINDESIEALRKMYKRIENGEETVSEDIWVRSTPERDWSCVRLSYYVVKNDKGSPLVAYGTVMDITQLRIAENMYTNEMHSRELQSSDVIVNCRVNISRGIVEQIRLKADVVEIEGNKASIDFETRAGEFFKELNISDEQREMLSPKSLLERYKNGGRGCETEYSARLKNGEFARVKVEVVLLSKPDTGDIIAFYYNNNITAIYVKEQIMKRLSHIDYELICCIDIKTDSYGVYAAAENTRVPPVYGAAYEIMITDFCRKYVNEEDAEDAAAAFSIEMIKKKLEEESVYTLKYNMLEFDGTYSQKVVRITYINKERGLVMFTRSDISEAVEKERRQNIKLKDALAEAEKAGMAKQMFLANMSHDMRTPMNAILGLSNLAMDSDDINEYREYMTQINESGQYLLSLINDVLDVSRIETGKMELNPQYISSTELLEMIISSVGVSAEQKGVHFYTKMPDFRHIMLYVDALKVAKIFINLLSNSVKFTPAGGNVYFILENIERSNGYSSYKITVKDDGIGMDKEFIPHIFEPFRQENTEITTNYRGTGLGMTIVKNMLDLMNADIDIKSEKGRGTEITIFMKFMMKEKPEEEPEKCSSLTLNRHGRVLLCEDHPLNAKIAQKLIENHGYLWETAVNGQIGVEMFAKSSKGYYDIILMDIRMPVMNGLEAARIIRHMKREDAKTIPIIAMTANAFSEDVQMTKEAGMNAHLSKPIDTKEFYHTIDKFIRKKTT